MKNRLNGILNTINDFYLYDDQVAQKYIALINEAIELICDLKATSTSLLENAINEALTELRNELANRMNDNFFNAPPERKKSEFKISKMLVAVAIGNVLSNLSAANTKG